MSENTTAFVVQLLRLKTVSPPLLVTLVPLTLRPLLVRARAHTVAAHCRLWHKSTQAVKLVCQTLLRAEPGSHTEKMTTEPNYQ